MSSRSSVSSNAPPKLPAQVISTPRTPRVYTQRKLSSARRVRDMRNLPEYDSRGLLADPLKAYSQPDALYEEKVKLTQEVDSLLTEVVPLREQAELISKQFDEPDRDPLEEVGEINLKQKIDKYQNEIELINKSLSKFAKVFTKKNEEELKGQIELDRREKSALESEIEALQNQLYNTADNVDVMNNSPSIDIVQDNNERIAELQKTLDDLKQEEADLLALHEKLLNTEPSDASKSSQLGPYLKQLQQLQHIRTKRSVEFKKAQRNYNSQVQFMEAVKADKLKKDRERKRREAWNKSFKNREAVNEENRKKLEENQNDTKKTLYSFYEEEEEKVEYETIRRITVHRHKHKRYHHKEKDPNPLMFKTEVEKTETLHITQPQKQDDTNTGETINNGEQDNINDEPNIMIDLQGNNNDEQNINNDEQNINNDEQNINNDEQNINNDEQNINNDEQNINNDEQNINNGEHNNNEEQEINVDEQGNNVELNNNNEEEEINVGEQRNNDEQNTIADEQGNIGDEQNDNNEEQNNNGEQEINADEEGNNNDEQEINNDEQNNNDDEQDNNNDEQNNNDDQGNNGDEQDNNNGEQNNENGEQNA